MKGKCSICGMVLRSHASAKNSARTNFLKTMRKHQWKNHRNTMISRIKAGKRKSETNPTVQDFISALQDAPGRAFSIYKKMRARDFATAKQVLDALEPVLPIEMRVTWKAIEAIHDELAA
ncbi:hypothetical protein ES705_42505 [subsurface metagenome]